MLRALAWKEWREQRSLVLAGTALAIVLPVLLFMVATVSLPRFSGRGLADVTALAFALMLWPMFVSAAGAGTFANESTGRTFGFLMSRPVSRGTIWGAKIVLAAIAGLSVIFASLLVTTVVYWLAGIPAAADPSLLVLGSVFGATPTLVLGAPSLYLVFAAAVFLSVRVARPFAAAIGGLAGSAVMLIMLMVLWPRVGLLTSVQSIWFVAEILVVATLLLALSLRRFARAEVNVGGGLARTVATFAGAMLATAALGFVPALYADIFADLDGAVTRNFALSPDGTVAVVTAVSYPASTGSLWRLPDQIATSGDGAAAATPIRLTRRVAFSPFFSRDGQRVYYFTARTLGGARGASVDLRTVRIDGSEDRLAIAAVGEIRYLQGDGWLYPTETPVVSASGSLIAFDEGWWGDDVLIIDLDRGEAHRIADTGSGAVHRIIDTGSGGRSVSAAVQAMAWTAEREILLYLRGRGRSGRGAERHAIATYDIDSGNLQEYLSLQGEDGDWWWARFLAPSVPLGGFVPSPLAPLQIYLRDRSGDRRINELFLHLAVLDLAAGEVETIESFPCGYPATAVSADGNVVAHQRFASCVEHDDGYLEPADPVLVVRNLRTGAAEEFVDWIDFPTDRELKFIAVSPRGSRVSFSVGRRRGFNEFRILEADRTMRTIEMRRFLDGVLRGPYAAPQWIDEDHLLVRYYTRTRIRYQTFAVAVVLNANDGSVAHEFIIPSYGGRHFLLDALEFWLD